MTSPETRKAFCGRLERRVGARPLKAPGTKRGHRTSKKPAPTPTFQNPHPNGALSPLGPPAPEAWEKGCPSSQKQTGLPAEKTESALRRASAPEAGKPSKSIFWGGEGLF